MNIIQQLNFLFWNTGRKPINYHLIKIIKERDVDILALAEYSDSGKELIKTLVDDGMHYYFVPQIGCIRITILSKFEPTYFKHLSETAYYTFKEIILPHFKKLLISFVHFPSKLFMSNDDQMDESRIFKNELEKIEIARQNTNTIILGDLNMNPFERGMVAATGIHAIPCSLTSKNYRRTVKGRQYSMFYNPMWNLFGDKDNKPGTYYFSQSQHLQYFWNILDQVIIRPTLIDSFKLESLEIIDKIGDTSLLNDRKRPCISDHLPIFFQLT